MPTQYQARINLNIYDSPACQALATQSAAGRYLQILSQPEHGSVVEVMCCEDAYSGWLRAEDFCLESLVLVDEPYQPLVRSTSEIQARLPQVIEFIHQAQLQPNHYLWGGTVAPNYDCSGLIQAAFASAGVWLPRDAYQQYDFTERVTLAALETGDLVFFGTPEKIDHVGLYLGQEKYIHSSGKDAGRNGIAIDMLKDEGDVIGRSLYQRLRGFGRVVQSFMGSTKYSCRQAS
jgi:hypothetical protein